MIDSCHIPYSDDLALLECDVDDHQPDHVQAELGAAPARTVVVRWWCERPHADDEEADQNTRGNVRELDGANLGAFSSFEALISLLHRLVAEARRRRN